jgi:hypothetical protein
MGTTTTFLSLSRPLLHCLVEDYIAFSCSWLFFTFFVELTQLVEDLGWTPLWCYLRHQAAWTYRSTTCPILRQCFFLSESEEVEKVHWGVWFLQKIPPTSWFTKTFPHSRCVPHLAEIAEEDGDVKQAHQEGKEVRGLRCSTWHQYLFSTRHTLSPISNLPKRFIIVCVTQLRNFRCVCHTQLQILCDSIFALTFLMYFITNFLVSCDHVLTLLPKP